MSRPIKVSDALYAQLQKRARNRASTMQDALASLMAEALESAEQLQGRMKRVEKALSVLERQAGAVEGQLQDVRTKAAGTRTRLEQLRDLRRQDTEAHNSWVPTWEAVDDAAQAIEALGARVDTLEAQTHRHWGQMVQEKVRT